MEPKVIFKNVSKRYSLYKKRSDKLIDAFLKEKRANNFYALRDVSFEVYEGETIGVVGINGSGKSTLSNLLAQVVPPTSGNIKINGQTSLIAISAGLNNNLTGIENIELKCLMLGLKLEEIKELTPQIIEFAELGDFIDQPVKNYSSGMRSRLGFAISVHTNPDILIVDEALSVGDQTFYEKCIAKMNDFKKEGKTIFFISHSISQIRSFADRVLWIHYGTVREFGNTRVVLNLYRQFITWFNDLTEEEKKRYKNENIAGQKKVEASIIKSRKKQKKKKDKNFLFIEFFILLILFLLSSLFMLFENHSAVLSQNENNGYNIKTEKNNPSIEINTIEKEINKVGYVSSEKLKLYQTEKLKKEVAMLSFMDEVFVVEEVNGLLKINVNKYTGFVKTNEIFIPNGKIAVSNIGIVDLLAAFPAQFQDAYEYYLLFLNEEQNTIETTLNGKTGEKIDKVGNKYINYNSVTFRINPDNKSDRIIIQDFLPENINMNVISENATYKSKSGKLLYIVTHKHHIIINLINNTTTIRLN